MDRVLSVSKAIFKITGLLFLAVLYLTPAGGPSIARAYQSGEVTARMLNIRSGPGRTHPIIDKVEKGHRFTVLDAGQEWIRVSHNGRKGYVHGKYIELLPAKPLEEENTPSAVVPSPQLPQENIDLNRDVTDEDAPPPFDPSFQHESIDTLKQEAGRIEKQIEAHETEVSAYTEKEAGLIDELDQIGRRLNTTRKEVKKNREKAAAVEAEIQETESAYSTLEKEIAQLNVYAAKRLVALYKLHQLGKMPVLASADSIFDMLRRKDTLERILAADKAFWLELTSKRQRLAALRNTLEEQKRTYDDTMTALNKKLADMNAQSEARSRLLNDIRGKKSLMIAAIDSLKEASRALDSKMDSYSWEVHPVGLSIDSKDKKPFQALKGLLQTPVTGRITEFYGLHKDSMLKTDNFKNGIDIEAAPGEPIRAVYAGTAIFADWFKGYGNMIIIDHGGDYFSIYAHAEEIFKDKGDPVDSNEVIGTVGDTGSMAGTKLYFELRHKGKPIDPLAWLKRN